MPLVLDGSNGTLVPPVDGVRQRLDAVVAVPLPDHAVAPGGEPGAEVGGAELVVGQIGELVHAEGVPVVGGAGVVRVDEAEVVPEDAEAAVVLTERVVGPAVLGEPEVVHRPRLGLRPLQPPRAVLLVVGDDGHVGRRGGGDGEEQEEGGGGEAPAQSHGGGRDETSVSF